MSSVKQPFKQHFTSLRHLADVISDVLQCSVTIEDAHHELVAYSSHPTESDQARIATIIGRKVPDEIIQALWQHGVFGQLMKSERPVKVPAIDNIGLGHRLAIAIHHRDIILGYIWLLGEHDKFNETAQEHLAQAAKAAKIKMLQLEMQHQKVEQGYHDFFWQLLMTHYATTKEIDVAAGKYGITLPKSFCVNVLQFTSEITERLYQQLRYAMITSFDKQIVLHICNKDQLIILEDMSSSDSTNKKGPLSMLLADMMHSRFNLSFISSGCGSTYDDLTLIEQSYKEALIVLQVKNKFSQPVSHLHRYDDLGFYRYLPIVLGHKKEYEQSNRFLYKLEQYDLKQNGNLLLTLETYLNHNSNMKETAEQLHIHENTLHYRLKRIVDISGIDLNNMDDKVTCFLEFKLKRFAK